MFGTLRSTVEKKSWHSLLTTFLRKPSKGFLTFGRNLRRIFNRLCFFTLQKIVTNVWDLLFVIRLNILNLILKNIFRHARDLKIIKKSLNFFKVPKKEGNLIENEVKSLYGFPTWFFIHSPFSPSRLVNGEIHWRVHKILWLQCAVFFGECRITLSDHLFAVKCLFDWNWVNICVNFIRWCLVRW